MRNPKAMLVLFSSVFIDLVGLGIVLPLLPFCGEKFGASPSQITFLFAIYSLMQFIFTLLWGSLSDRFGRRPLLLLSIAGSGISYLWFGFSNSFGMLLAARALAGIMGSSIVVAQAYIADVTEPEDRAKYLGIIGAAFGMGFILGPAIGGILGGSDPQNPNFSLPLFIAAGISFLAFAVAYIYLPESLSKTNQSPQLEKVGKLEPSVWLKNTVEILQRPHIGRLIWLYFLISLAIVGSQSILPLWLEKQFGWGPEGSGYLFIFCGIVAAVIQGGLIGPLNKRFGEGKLLLSGLSMNCFGLLMIPFFHNLPLLLAAIMLAVGGEAVTRPSLSSLLSRSAGAEEQGRVMGVSQSFAALARIASPLGAGLFFQELGIGWPFYCGGMLLLGAALLTVGIVRNYSKFFGT